MAIKPVLSALAFSLSCGTAMAQSYPVKPIRLINPTVGGAYESVARAMQPFLQEDLGQPIVMESRAGGGGVVGLEFVSRADPDGYTLLQMGVSQAVLNPLFVGKVPYDSVNDFTHIGMMGELTMALWVHPASGAKDFKSLIAYAKANPGKVAYGSSGVGQSFHLAGEMLKLRTGADLLHVPYKGTPLALQDFFAGRLLMMFYPPASVITERAKTGGIIPVAAMSATRLASLPDVPTFEELGVGNLGVSGWAGFSGPAKLPRPIVMRINQAVNKASARPEMAKAYEAMTMVPLRSTPEEMADRVRREINFWREMTAKLGIKPEN